MQFLSRLGLTCCLILLLVKTSAQKTYSDKLKAPKPDSCLVKIPTAMRLGHDALKVTCKCSVDSFSLKVYDRRGILVYNSTDINDEWVGVYKQKYCREDAYIWKLHYYNKKSISKVGTIMLWQ